MKKNIYRASGRGTADYGWLKANYSFSFANYYHPEKVNFGALRVLNDDIIEGGMGFGTHPHENMEIITIPLKGSLKHRDSMSNTWIPIKTGEVQVMSAGSGIMHSEVNNLPNESINLFQIWIVPNKQNVTPRYDQKAFSALERADKLQVLVSSIDEELKCSLKIHQNAQISRIDLSKGKEFTYQLKSENNGVYLMVIDGEITVDNTFLSKRDAIGVYQTLQFSIHSQIASELLFIEVPMQF